MTRVPCPYWTDSGCDLVPDCICDDDATVSADELTRHLRENGDREHWAVGCMWWILATLAGLACWGVLLAILYWIAVRAWPWAGW
jgi:hypothetical protein